MTGHIELSGILLIVIKDFTLALKRIYVTLTYQYDRENVSRFAEKNSLNQTPANYCFFLL